MAVSFRVFRRAIRDYNIAGGILNAAAGAAGMICPRDVRIYRRAMMFVQGSGHDERWIADAGECGIIRV